MPEYLFENPDTGEILSIAQGIDEEHSYYKNNNSESLRNIMGPANMKLIEENPASE